MRIEAIDRFYVAIPETMEEVSAGHSLGYARDAGGYFFETEKNAQSFKELVMAKVGRNLPNRAAEEESGLYATLTKREAFVAMMVQAHVTNGEYAYGKLPGEEYEDSMIRASIRIADKLIKGLEGK